MHQHEEFADAVIVPGPNLRGRFTDTEQVDDGLTEQPDDPSGICPTCRRTLAHGVLVCPDDGAAVVALPRLPSV